MSTSTPTVAELLKYADLQMAAEAFLRDRDTGNLRDSGRILIDALVQGNDHSSRFTQLQAEEFAKHWRVLDQKINTPTGFSGSLFENLETGELVMSVRSTEFIDDSARDNQATNTLEVAETGFAWGQLRVDRVAVDGVGHPRGERRQQHHLRGWPVPEEFGSSVCVATRSNA